LEETPFQVLGNILTQYLINGIFFIMQGLQAANTFAGAGFSKFTGHTISKNGTTFWGRSV
jgi:hypothetical protein